MSGDRIKLEGLSSSQATAKALSKVISEARADGPWLGWVDLPFSSQATVSSTRWLKKLKKNQKTLCVLGIGGSCLGTKAIYDFLQPEKEVLFFDNIDGYSFEKRLGGLDFKTSHFLAVSKSGETAETLFQLAHVLQVMRKKKLNPALHVSTVTEDKSSTLKRLTDELGLQGLSVPANVGGRFSVFSEVGIAPLLWAGVPVKQLLRGASEVSQRKTLASDLAEFFLKGFGRQEWISVFWIYVEDLRTFGLWLEQLWAESLAKAKAKSGGVAPRASTPLSCVGATDQHSLLQQFVEGARDKHFLFIRNLQSEKSTGLGKPVSDTLSLVQNKSVGQLLKVEGLATQEILNQLGISTGQVIMADHSAQSIGALMYLFELAVATLGECLDINAFDQPGVEGVKKVTLGTLGDTRYRDQALKNL